MIKNSSADTLIELRRREADKIISELPSQATYCILPYVVNGEYIRLRISGISKEELYELLEKLDISNKSEK